MPDPASSSQPLPPTRSRPDASTPRSALAKTSESWQLMQQQLAGKAAPSTDPRFAAPAWQQWPFNLYAHAYGQLSDWSLEALGTGLDLALCEATFTQDHEGTAQHMSGRQAGASARAAGAKRLVVTHRWPTIGAEALRAEAQEAFGGPLAQAAVGRGYSL